MDKKEYVLGFQFNGNEVVMIRKNRPEWQAGLINGVGGKIESGETPLEAMIREFEEETSVHHQNWNQYVTLEGKDFIVYVFSSYGIYDYSEYKSLTDEEVIIVHLTAPFADSTQFISNIPWLLAMAIDEDASIRKKIKVQYS